MQYHNGKNSLIYVILYSIIKKRQSYGGYYAK